MRMPSTGTLTGYLARIETELRELAAQRQPLVPPHHLLSEPKPVREEQQPREETAEAEEATAVVGRREGGRQRAAHGAADGVDAADNLHRRRCGDPRRGESPHVDSPAPPPRAAVAARGALRGEDVWRPRQDLLDSGADRHFFQAERSRSPRRRAPPSTRVPEQRVREMWRQLPSDDAHQTARSLRPGGGHWGAGLECPSPPPERRRAQASSRTRHFGTLGADWGSLSAVPGSTGGRPRDVLASLLGEATPQGEGSHATGIARGCRPPVDHGLDTAISSGAHAGDIGTGRGRALSEDAFSMTQGLLALEDLPRGASGGGAAADRRNGAERSQGREAANHSSTGSSRQPSGGGGGTRLSGEPRRWDFTSDLPFWGSSGA